MVTKDRLAYIQRLTVLAVRLFDYLGVTSTRQGHHLDTGCKLPCLVPGQHAIYQILVICWTNTGQVGVPCPCNFLLRERWWNTHGVSITPELGLQELPQNVSMNLLCLQWFKTGQNAEAWGSWFAAPTGGNLSVCWHWRWEQRRFGHKRHCCVWQDCSSKGGKEAFTLSTASYMDCFYQHMSRWGCWISLGYMLASSWATMSWPRGGNAITFKIAIIQQDLIT